MRTNIRPATEKDVARCVYMAHVFHDGSQFAGVTDYVAEDATAYAIRCLSNPSKLFMVYEKDDEVVGFFICGKHPVPWNREQFISEEELFFILPEYKSPRIALKLFKAWEDWCVSNGVKHMAFCPTSFVDEDIDRWDGFCRVVDFKRGGVYYKKVLSYAD